uniref:Uncharacterized protein n=1 Tax=Suricata suricatta TaxID=37032 RepID=A0A673U7J0_SURSU
MIGLLTNFRRAPSSSPAKASSAIMMAPSSVRPLLVRSPMPVAPDTSSRNLQRTDMSQTCWGL